MPKQKNVLLALGRTSKAIRVKKKISIEKLSEKSGVDADRLKQFEKGKVDIDIHELARIAYCLGVLISTLVARAKL